MGDSIFLPNIFSVLVCQTRGGIMFWADSLGANHIHSRLDVWSNMYGGLFKPCTYLAERASKGLSLVRKLCCIYFAIGLLM